MPKIYELGATGWTTKRDFTADYPTASDAALRADKMFLVNDGSVVGFDVDAGDTTFTIAPKGETKPAKFVEYLPTADVVCLVYSDNGGTSLYELKGDQLKAVAAATYPAEATKIHSRGKYIVLVAGDAIYLHEGGTTTSTLRYTHDEAITHVRVEADGLIVFGDASGRTGYLSPNSSTPVFVDDRSFSVNAWAPFLSFANAPLGAIGGADEYLFLQSVSGTTASFNAAWNWDEGATIIALENHKDGDVESLLVSVVDGADTFVTRLEKVPKPALAYEGSDVVDYFHAPLMFS
jgi:hypothetical protein